MGKILLTLWLSLGLAITALATPDPDKNFANEIFNFVFKYAIRAEFDPLQYAYDDAYELQRIAKWIYRKRDICKTTPPDSVWERGAYKPFNFLVKAKHHSIIYRVNIRFEKCHHEMLGSWLLTSNISFAH